MKPFEITADDVGRYVRRKSTGEVGTVKIDPGNGWLHTGIVYEWVGYRNDFEYVTVEPLETKIVARQAYDETLKMLDGLCDDPDLPDPDLIKAIRYSFRLIQQRL